MVLVWGVQRMRNCPTSVLRSIPAVLAGLLAGFLVACPKQAFAASPSPRPPRFGWLAPVSLPCRALSPASLFLLRRQMEKKKLIRNSKRNRCIGPRSPPPGRSTIISKRCREEPALLRALALPVPLAPRRYWRRAISPLAAGRNPSSRESNKRSRRVFRGRGGCPGGVVCCRSVIAQNGN